MTEKIKEITERVLYGQIRERVFALFCLVVIAIVAMYKVTDPENIIINIILVISGIVGAGIGSLSRKTDQDKKGDS